MQRDNRETVGIRPRRATEEWQGTNIGSFLISDVGGIDTLQVVAGTVFGGMSSELGEGDVIPDPVNGISKIESVSFKILNNFKTNKKEVWDFRFESSAKQIRVIEALNGELVTNEIIQNSLIEDGNLVW